MAPSAANHGAIITPITPTVAGISSNVFPSSSLIIILVTFPSRISFLTVFTRSSDDTWYCSVFTSFILAPHFGQKFASFGNSAPHFLQ